MEGRLLVEARCGALGEIEARLVVAVQLLREQPIGQVDVLEHDVRAQNFTGARIGEARPVPAEGRDRRGCPAEDVVANVARVPLRIVRLHLNLDRVLEAGGFEALVPGEGAFLDDVAVLDRGRVLDPPHDRLHRLGKLGLRIFLDEPPAVDEVPIGRDRGVRLVGDPVGEIPHPVIGETGGVILVRHGDEGVLKRDGHRAAVGHRGACGEGGSVEDVIDDDVHVLRIIADVRVLRLLRVEAAENARAPLP